VGEVCHIKGEKPTAPRHDATQDNETRHGFDNLILLCNVHHKIIDGNEDDYPVPVLLQMKCEHESKFECDECVDDQLSDAFVSKALSIIGN